MLTGLVAQGICGGGYLMASGLLLARRERVGLALAMGVGGLHLGLVLSRWWATGQLPLVSRYEDLTVDALITALFYLVLQWRCSMLRRGGSLSLAFAAILTLSALAYPRDAFPLGPALQSGWLLVHAQLNSLAIAAATLTASLGLLWREGMEPVAVRLLVWSLGLWSAMVAVGSYWASLAWGRFWGWDPIESWSLGTLLAYAVVIHLRLRSPAGRFRLRLALLPYGLLLFTTYGLLLVRKSIHGSYLFQ